MRRAGGTWLCPRQDAGGRDLCRPARRRSSRRSLSARDPCLCLVPPSRPTALPSSAEIVAAIHASAGHGGGAIHLKGGYLVDPVNHLDGPGDLWIEGAGSWRRRPAVARRRPSTAPAAS